MVQSVHVTKNNDILVDVLFGSSKRLQNPKSKTFKSCIVFFFIVFYSLNLALNTERIDYRD